ncbi:ISL3 family transposase [Gordonia sp. PP30]|uniref:ISL3 family transposase n=1 Tax=Gordonia sp. PP30 TaxID=2935861 RepID=UPI001FFEB0B1|nr:ISL3 family transposase [Gordonia sp. PP30]UQE75229.1 ISL3 family transposase [Gordonia sp. PP30]UQE75554.1 ISL3 family transposase [Gordonia sp. PP30]
MSELTSLLLGLEGVQVVGVDILADRTRVVDVVTADPRAACCPDCGHKSRSVKDRAVTTPRDIGYGTDPIVLRWNKIRWRCRNPECKRASFTEAIEQIPARRRTTSRLRRQIGLSVGEHARSVAEVAAEHKVSWPTAHTAFCEVADEVLDAPEPVRMLGIDETRRGRPRWKRSSDGRWYRVDPWDTGFVDLDGVQGLLGQTTGRTSAAVADWLNAQPAAFRASITHVAIDPCAAYAAAVAQALPDAQVVVDHFHLIKLANDMVTAVRRRVTWERRGRRGRAVDPEWANRRRLLTARERLSEKNYKKMWDALRANDPGNEVLAAYIVKEELRVLLALARCQPDRHRLRHKLYRFYDLCAEVNMPEVTKLASTIETWWAGIAAFLDTGITNARTEGYNRLVKQVKRAACGFRNLENSRRRIRFHCTRKQRASIQTHC